jgi:hypothetical protein
MGLPDAAGYRDGRYRPALRGVPTTTSGSSVDPRPWPRRLRQWPFLGVLAGVVAGLLIVAADRFRLGSALVAMSLVGGAVLRGVLPTREAGLLVVRSRAVDVLALGGLGVGLGLLTVVVPPPS